MSQKNNPTIAVAGLGYVGLSNSILLAQNHHVIATDISGERVDMINRRESPLVDEEIIEYLSKHKLDLTCLRTLQPAFS